MVIQIRVAFPKPQSGWFGFHGLYERPDNRDELRRPVGRAASVSRNSPQDAGREGKREERWKEEGGRRKE